MNIIISGIHLNNYPKAEKYAKEKVSKLSKFHPHILEFEVRLFFEKSHHSQKHDFACSIKAVIPGNDVEIVEGDLSIDMAIDKAVDKMKRALVKNKEKATTKKHKAGLFAKARSKS